MRLGSRASVRHAMMGPMMGLRRKDLEIMRLLKSKTAGKPSPTCIRTAMLSLLSAGGKPSRIRTSSAIIGNDGRGNTIPPYSENWGSVCCLIADRRADRVMIASA